MTFVSAKARQICDVFEIQFATKIQIFGGVKSFETTFHSNGTTIFSTVRSNRSISNKLYVLLFEEMRYCYSLKYANQSN